MKGERLPIIGSLIKEIDQYRLTEEEEKARVHFSSVRSSGRVGKINRFIAKMTRQEEVDIVAFFKSRPEDS